MTIEILPRLWRYSSELMTATTMHGEHTTIINRQLFVEDDDSLIARSLWHDLKKQGLNLGANESDSR